MANTSPEHESTDPEQVVGNPQAGDAAGGRTSWENETDPGESVVESPQDDKSRAGNEHDPDPDPAHSDDSPGDDDPDTFDREYVERLRRESGDHRRRARDAERVADELRAELWRERVDALGLLADPGDLPFDADLLDDPYRIRAAVEHLLDERPHLRTRRIRARIGQGEGSPTTGVSLSALLRGGA